MRTRFVLFSVCAAALFCLRATVWAADGPSSRDELFTMDDEDDAPAAKPAAKPVATPAAPVRAPTTGAAGSRPPVPGAAATGPATQRAVQVPVQAADKRPGKAEPAEASLDAPALPPGSPAGGTKPPSANPAAAKTAPARPAPAKVADAPPARRSASQGTGIRWSGFAQEEVARQYASPSHLTKVRTRAQLNAQGTLASDIKWKLGARLDYDAVFDLTDHYPGAVRQNRQLDLLLRENYADIGAGPLELRIGRQHIVWGEMVGLFFADVVSARDTREFVLPEFEYQRLPQWALRAEHFRGDWHSELIWIPYVTVDEYGRYGDDFHPGLISVTGLGLQVRDRVKPGRGLGDSNAGLRVGVLKDGWDVAAFYYSSIDATPHFTRTIENLPGPTLVYTPRHSRIGQAGGTFAKDFGRYVLKGEAVYTRGRKFSVTDLADTDGIVKQNLLDYALGVEFGPREQDILFNVQVFQRWFLNHVSTLVPDRSETGVSFLARGKFGNLTPQLLVIQSLNRNDRLLRPSVDWAFARNYRARAGLDVFSGPAEGLFGQYAATDRAYVELKYSF